MKLRYVLLASTIIGTPIPAFCTGIPVVDILANAQLAEQGNYIFETLANTATQISQLSNMISIAEVASTALGDSVSPELTNMFTSMQSAYSRSNQAYNSLMAIPGNIDRELAWFQPPPGGFTSMSPTDAIERVKRISRLTGSTSAAAVSRQADEIEALGQRQAARAAANGMSDRSVSALSATQAVAQQMRVAGDNLERIEQSNSDMLTIAALRADKERLDKDVREVQAQTDIAAMQADLAKGYPELQTRPSKWTP